jgi:hypothetical protein
MGSVTDKSLPYSQSCENNKAIIGQHLQALFAGRSQVLEIASGTGQHATFFAGQLGWLTWQPTEVPANLTVLEPRCSYYEGSNLAEPLPLDVCVRPWGVAVPDAIFTANSLHIMPFSSVQALFLELGLQAAPNTLFTVYGPFNYCGQYTSDSNAQFDRWLFQANPDSAIRNFEEVDQLARKAGFTLQGDNAMPANNRLLVWSKNS